MKIFFDLDGTLIDVSEKYYRIYSDFALLKKIEYLTKEEYWSMKRAKKSNLDIFKNNDLAEEFKIFFTERIESPTYLNLDIIFPFTIEVLESLQANHQLSLMTLRHNRKEMEEEIKRFEILPYFKEILSAAPPPFVGNNFEIKAEILSKKVNPEDTIVGDSKADIESGKRLGIRTIGVLSGVSNSDIMKKLEPDFIIPDISKIEPCLKK